MRRKREFEDRQKVEQQRLAWMKKRQQENRKLEEAKRKEEEKKRLEALQRKLEEQRKKEALLQKEKWEAHATPPAVTKRSFDAAKEVRVKTTPGMEEKEQGNQLEGPSIGRQDSWLIIDSPIVTRQRLSPPPPRPRPYKFSGGQDSRKPRPRSEVFSVSDVIIQPIRMPLQKAPITQKRSGGDSGSSSPNPDRGRDAIKPETGQAVFQSTAPSNAVLKEKVRDMQERRLKVSNRVGSPCSVLCLSELGESFRLCCLSEFGRGVDRCSQSMQLRTHCTVPSVHGCRKKPFGS